MKQVIFLFLVLSVLLVSCAQKQQSAQIANPASVYCEEQGGKLQIVAAEDGSQSGNCILKDGTVCEEWAYYRKECPK